MCKNNSSLENKIDLSIIIPVYNVETYLSACIESALQQGDLRFEIILVNDGSTDRSGAIADEYAHKDCRIRVVHQENGGASAARNSGLSLAQGDYIAFVDSDDWVKENSLFELYREATKYQADVVMGKIWMCHQNGRMDIPFEPVPKEIMDISLSGKECFVSLFKTKSYSPMVYNYIYRREYLETIQARFEKGTMVEDELWTPTVLCQTDKMVIVDVEFYYYRLRQGSVTQITCIEQRLISLFRVTDKLFEFADRFDFIDKDRELKNWLYVDIFTLYLRAFSLLSHIKDSSFIIPEHHLDRFWRDCWEMMPEPQKICKEYFIIAEAGLKKYTDWRTSEWVASIGFQVSTGKRLMLIYNTHWGEELSLKISDIPADWVITTDRRYFQQADAVVFHLPDLQHMLDIDLDKQQGQIWVGWYLDSEKNYPWIRSAEMMKIFDLWMSYRQDADVVYPYYRYEYPKLFMQQIPYIQKQNKACMFGPNRLNHAFTELMKLTAIDVFGGVYNNQQLHTFRQTEKLDIYRKYKFVIAFENAIDVDYITDIFYDPLIAGSVPVYLGVSNITDYAPSDHCFVDVRQFEDPKALANFINACYDDEQLYANFFEWKNQSLKEPFLQKIEKQKDHPFIRLCRQVEEKITNYK
jgi:glycosyltransferase involved in cell wall biosynthesis